MNKDLLKKAMMLRVGLGVTGFIMIVIYAVLGWATRASLLSLSWIIGLWVAVGVVTLVIMAAAVVFREKIWLRDPVEVELKELRNEVARHVKVARNTASRLEARPHQIPWNMFIGIEGDTQSTTMSELGYVEFGQRLKRKGLSISSWSSQSAIAYRIDIVGEDAAFELIAALSKALRKLRPTLPVNAFYVELELTQLASLDGAASGRLATMNMAINNMVDVFGVVPPINIALLGLEHAQDLARAAILTEAIGEGSLFGGFVDMGQSDQINSVQSIFDELVRRMDAAQTEALQKQLAPEFCASLVNAPYQLQAICAQLLPVIKSLIRPLPPRTMPLVLQSVFFAGGSGVDLPVDPISQLNSQKYFDRKADLPATVVEGSVTARHGRALAAAYHLESFHTKPNLKELLRERTKGLIISAVLLGIVALNALFAFDSYRSHVAINTDLEKRFEDYYQYVNALDDTADSLVPRVYALADLRDGLGAYEALPLGPILFSWLPDWSMEKHYREIYEKELLGSYQLSLADHLERDMFAYNQLADGVTLFSLALLEVQFFKDQAANADNLTSYYRTSLSEQGEVSAQFQTALSGTLGDLWALNQPPLEARNTELNAVVARTLKGLNTADVLYQLILRQPAFAERVDLRSLLGPRFAEVFEAPENASSYLVRSAFTRAGFDAMFKDGELAALRNMIGDYQTLIGTMEQQTVDNLRRRVSELYTTDYIAHWNSFVSDLRLKEADDWLGAQVLVKALTNPTENPVARLLSALKANTAIDILPQTEEGAEVTPEQQAALDRLKSSTEAISARNISAAFSDYLAAETVDGKLLTEFDILLAYSRNVALWIDAAATAPDGSGKYLLEQYKTGGAATPLAILSNFTSSSDLEIIRTFGASLSSTLDAAAMKFVTDYVNSQWNLRVYQPFAGTVESSFPFVSQSVSDMPLAEFAALFSPEGAMATFKAEFLSRFEVSPGNFQAIPTFLPSGSLRLNQTAEKMLSYSGEYAQTMFVDGKPFLNFRLRVGLMDPTLSQMTLTSGVTLHNYSHGPIAWSDQSWPLAGVQDSTLTLRAYERSRPVLNQRYSGPWSWFRMTDSGTGSINPSLGIAECLFIAKDYPLVLQFDVAQRYTPFDPDFFKRFKMPRELFEENVDQ